MYESGSDKPTATGDSPGTEHVLQDVGGSGADQQHRPDEPDSSGAECGGKVFALPARTAGHQGVSKALVLLELAEHQKDLAAFSSAYSAVHSRVQEVKDEARLMQLVNWSGTAAVMGSLELTIHAIERTVMELKDILKRLDAGAIINLDEE